MKGANTAEWYIRLRREKNTPATPDKQFTLAQLFTSPYQHVDHASSLSASGRHKSSGIIGGGILLGRQSSSQQEGPETRGFASPIVSRTHAQLLVTRNGHVYITDLASLHGTTITPLDTSERTFTLVPMSPTQLLEGDTLILGKTVLASDRAHEPIRLIVEFAHPAAGVSARGTRDIISLAGSPAAYEFAASRHGDAVLRAVAPAVLVEVKAKAAATVVEVVPVSSSPAPDIREGSRELISRSVSPIDSSSGRYGIPKSLLYVSGDEEDLPRGDGSEIREQSDDSAVSTSYSLPSLQAPPSPPAQQREWESLPAPQARRTLSEQLFPLLRSERHAPAFIDARPGLGQWYDLHDSGSSPAAQRQEENRNKLRSPNYGPNSPLDGRAANFLIGSESAGNIAKDEPFGAIRGFGLPLNLGGPAFQSSSVEHDLMRQEMEEQAQEDITRQAEDAQAEAEEDADLGAGSQDKLGGLASGIFVHSEECSEAGSDQSDASDFGEGTDHDEVDDHAEKSDYGELSDFAERGDDHGDRSDHGDLSDYAQRDDHLDLDDHHDEMDFNEAMDADIDAGVELDEYIRDAHDEELSGEDDHDEESDDGRLDEDAHLDEDDHLEGQSEDDVEDGDEEDDGFDEASEAPEERKIVTSGRDGQRSSAKSVTLTFGNDRLPKLTAATERPPPACINKTRDWLPPLPSSQHRVAIPNLLGHHPAASEATGLSKADDIKVSVTAGGFADNEMTDAEQDPSLYRLEASSLLAKLLEKKHKKHEETAPTPEPDTDTDEESDDGGSYINEENEQEAFDDEEDYADSSSDDEVAALEEEQEDYAADGPPVNSPRLPHCEEMLHVMPADAALRLVEEDTGVERSDADSPPPRDPDYGTWYSYSDHEDDEPSGPSRRLAKRRSAKDELAIRAKKFLSTTELPGCSTADDARRPIGQPSAEMQEVDVKQEQPEIPALQLAATGAFAHAPNLLQVNTSSFGQEQELRSGVPVKTSEPSQSKKDVGLVFKPAPSPADSSAPICGDDVAAVPPSDFPSSPHYCALSPPPEGTSPPMSPLSPAYRVASPCYTPVSPQSDYTRSISPGESRDDRTDTPSHAGSDACAQSDEDAGDSGDSDAELSAGDDDDESHVSEDEEASVGGFSDDDEAHSAASEEESLYDSDKSSNLSDPAESEAEQDVSSDEEDGEIPSDGDERFDDDEEGRAEDSDEDTARLDVGSVKKPSVEVEESGTDEAEQPSVVQPPARDERINHASPPVEVDAMPSIAERASPQYAAPWSSPTASTSSVDSEPYPVTPPSHKRALKRTHDDMVDVVTGSDTEVDLDSPVAVKVQKVAPGDITAGQVPARLPGNGYFKTAGWIALGAVFGSVGTIAGLMQLSD